MTLFQNILNKVGLTTLRNSEKEIIKYKSRAWNAAKSLRSVYGWTTSIREINSEIKSDLNALKARARDLRLNNPVVAGYCFDYRANVVGSEGFDLQPLVTLPNGELNDPVNEFLKMKFDEWCDEKYCTMSQRYSFLLSQYQVADQLGIDGEFLIHLIDGIPNDENPFGISQEFLDPNDIDVDKNVELKNGGAIIMGIQYDRWRRIQNIWLSRKSIYGELTGSSTRDTSEPIPNNRLLFGIDLLHPKQSRGISPLAPAMITIMGLDMWENYSLDNAKDVAARVGFITKSLDAVSSTYSGGGSTEEDGESDSSSDPALDSGKYADRDTLGGTWEELPAGWDIKQPDSNFPHAQHNPFVRGMGRKIAMAIGADYTILFGDRENETYSSQRAAELKMRRMWAIKQTIMREQYLIRLYDKWLKSSLLTGALSPLSFANIDEYKKHYWQGVVQPWVDISKEAEGFQTMRQNGWLDDIDIITQSGRRPDEVLRNIARFKRMKEKYDLTNEDFNYGKDNSGTDQGKNEKSTDDKIAADDKSEQGEKSNRTLSVIRNPG